MSEPLRLCVQQLLPDRKAIWQDCSCTLEDVYLQMIGGLIGCTCAGNIRCMHRITPQSVCVHYDGGLGSTPRLALL